MLFAQILTELIKKTLVHVLGKGPSVVLVNSVGVDGSDVIGSALVLELLVFELVVDVVELVGGSECVGKVRSVPGMPVEVDDVGGSSVGVVGCVDVPL